VFAVSIIAASPALTRRSKRSSCSNRSNRFPKNITYASTKTRVELSVAVSGISSHALSSPPRITSVFATGIGLFHYNQSMYGWYVSDMDLFPV
jgi:hypothetical protein